MLLADTRRWNMICAALDVIGDTEAALGAYVNAPATGHPYINAYGVLQALYLQQDAVRDIFEALDIDFTPSAALKEIRQIRNETIGHPTNIARGQAFVIIVTQEFQRKRVQKRLEEKPAPRRIFEFSEPVYVGPPSIPSALIREVLNREAVLFAGAGMSLAAGMPSASLLAQFLADSIREVDSDYMGAPTVAGVAADLEVITSRHVLVEKIASLLNPPQGLTETKAHASAVELFDLIFTTNWDDLFEQTLAGHGDDRPTVADALTGRA